MLLGTEFGRFLKHFARLNRSLCGFARSPLPDRSDQDIGGAFGAVFAGDQRGHGISLGGDSLGGQQGRDSLDRTFFRPVKAGTSPPFRSDRCGFRVT